MRLPILKDEAVTPAPPRPAGGDSSPAAPRTSFPGLSEADLAHLWEGQRFPPQALRARDGASLRVVYRGRRQEGPGPDFRDAIIATPGALLSGDIELHVRASDFRRHGHHLDPAYDALILHVVFWDDEGEDTLLRCGHRVPVLALAGWVARRAQEIKAWLEQPALWQEPCRTALARLGPAQAGRALDRLGDLRLAQKAAAFAKGIAAQGPEETLYRRLLEALGYSQNRQPFLALAQALPWRRLQAALAAAPPAERPRLAEALLWGAASGFPWRRQGLRPGNLPQRRLAGAAHLAARYAEPGLLASLMAAVRQAAEEGPQALTKALKVREGGLALIGDCRAAEMAVNVVLPFALAWGDPWLGRAAAALYRRYPRPSPYGVTGHLDRALHTNSREGIAVDARRQQGMLYLYRNYCSRGGCGRCPLS